MPRCTSSGPSARRSERAVDTVADRLDPARSKSEGLGSKRLVVLHTHRQLQAFAVQPRIPNTRGERLRLAYRGDAEVSFSHVWFAPMDSTRVYPKRIHIGDDAL